jgi:hypothetical protein
MSIIWTKMNLLASTIRYKMKSAGYSIHDPILEKYSWENHVYASDQFRRGHVEVVDKRDDYGLFILHATIFPNTNSNAPIWGFDVVCGANKITGAFHDFSLVETFEHPMYQWFKAQTRRISWKKERQLPEWAQAIFSPAMVAAGNINDQKEVDQLISLGLDTLDYYLDNLKFYNLGDADYTDMQNRYCHYQKQNPHVVRSMVAMGFEQQVVEGFVEEVLFPELHK